MLSPPDVRAWIHHSIRPLSIGLLAALFFTLLGLLPSFAAPTFVADYYDDTHDANPGDGLCADSLDPDVAYCSLRAAFEESVALGGAQSISIVQIGKSGNPTTYTLVLGSLSTGSSDVQLSIEATGTDPIVIDGYDSFTDIHTHNCFDVGPEASLKISGVTIVGCQTAINAASEVELHGVTLGDNSDSAVRTGGGALGIYDSSVIGNTGVDGGGIHAAGSPTVTTAIQIQNSQISGNQATRGGALYLDGVSGLNIVSSTLGNNAASAEGGALWLGGSVTPTTTLEIRDTTIWDNHALQGGGAYVAGVPLLVGQSTVSTNTATTGAGIYVSVGGPSADALDVVNSTISGNQASEDGGGIYVAQGIAELSNATVALNSADVDANGTGSGGGLFQSGSSTIRVRNTLVARNVQTASSASSYAHDCQGTITSNSYNVFGRVDATSCSIVGSTVGNKIGSNAAEIDPRIADLGRASPSEPTLYHALLSISPALNAGSPGGCVDQDGVAIVVDQAGQSRPYPAGGRCDVGSYESRLDVVSTYLPAIRR